MNTKFLKSIVTIFFLLCLYTTSIGLENEDITKDNILINNTNNNTIKIDVTDVLINNKLIELDKIYNASVILTMNVKNNGIEDIELSNLDIYPYQGDLSTKYFVSTYDDINGFIGNIKSGESKTLKIGVTLHNTKEPIRLEFNNIDDVKESSITKTINIK